MPSSLLVAVAALHLLAHALPTEESEQKSGSCAAEGNAEACPSSSSSSSLLSPSEQKLLVASNGRFFWFDVRSGEERLLHDEHGVYFGSFAGDPTDKGDATVWVVGRRESHFAKKPEYLVQLQANPPNDPDSRRPALREVPLPGGWGVHDAIRLDDRVFVASTISGEILELEYPNMALAATHKFFERGDHMNTLSPASFTSVPANGEDRGVQLFAMLHGRSKPSRLVKVQLNASQTSWSKDDEKSKKKSNKKTTSGPSRQERGQRGGGTQTPVLLQDPRVLAVLQKLGQGCHGIVQLGKRAADTEGPTNGSESESGDLNFLFLSSDEGRLYRTSVARSATGAISPELVLVWEDPDKAFVKGLVVVGNVAYLGANRWKRSTELVAVDLSTGQELFRRPVPSARGTLNMLSTPHLSPHSPWLAAEAWETREGW